MARSSWLLCAAGLLASCSLTRPDVSDCSSNSECRASFGPGSVCGGDGLCQMAPENPRCSETHPADLLTRPEDHPNALIFGSLEDRSVVTQEARENAVRLAELGANHLRSLGARGVRLPSTNGGPSTNLVGGTCRIGDDPRTSVLDRHCRAHEVSNLFVTDGSFMPSGGAVPFTFTIYANAMRVGQRIVEQLGGPRPG